MEDWNDATARFNHIRAVGTEQYNADMLASIEKSTVSHVNGYGIRAVSTRFGRLYAVMATVSAFATIEQAQTHARSLEPGSRVPANR